MLTNALFINGEWLAGEGEALTSENPATGEAIWQATSASPSDVQRAVVSAKNAWQPWALLSLQQRADYLQAYKKILEKEKESISQTIADETGKPLWEAATEAAALIGKIDLSISAFDQRTGNRETKMDGASSFLRHKPHGVVAVFGPYNFPCHLPNGHIVPALLAGNTVVFKPSELTPLCAQIMVEYWERAELPRGVLNLVQGKRETGVSLAGQANISGLFFTGSSATGHLLHKQFGGQPGKILALEMGGNNPLIVHEAADVKAAVYHTIQSAYITAGQRCTCARRLIVPKGEAGDIFVTALQHAVNDIVVGADNPENRESQPFMGCLISNKAADDLLAAQATLLSLGATPLNEMHRVVEDRPYLSPGLIDVTNVQEVPDTEYFGPLLQLVRVDNFEQAINTANDTEYGLSAGLISDNPKHYEHFLSLSRAGIINWNRPITGASGSAPFGGIGASGNHRPSAYYAADYCAYPVASVEAEQLVLPGTLTPGVSV